LSNRHKMSFRDSRLLTENLRVLGYPKLVSIESFRESNFKLVAEILIWLSAIYEPREQIPTSVESEHERLALIKAVATLFLTKQHIRLNAKRLYQADGYAVKELLKLVTQLVEAVRSAPSGDSEATLSRTLNSAIKNHEIKELRDKVAKLSRSGATVYEALDIELRCKNERQRAIQTHRELAEVEGAIKQATKIADKNAEMALGKLGNAAGDEQSVQTKIEKKRAELERTQKRLRQLNQLRPAYQDELDDLQTDLKSLYDEYATKYRNVVYLEQLLEGEKKNLPQAEEILVNHSVEDRNDLNLDDPGLESYEEDDLTDDDEMMLGNERFQRPRPHELSDEDDLTDDDSGDEGLPTNDEDDF